MQLSESSAAAASSAAASAAVALLQQRSVLRGMVGGIGSIPPPGSSDRSGIHTHSSLTQANLARINNANAQDCHQGKASLHQSLKKGMPHKSESVADASYYSSVLASFGSAGGTTGPSPDGMPVGSSGTAGCGGVGAVAGAGGNMNLGNSTQLTSYETGNAGSGTGSNWQQTQYYR